MDEKAEAMRVQCLKCRAIVEHDPRRIRGCVCDPDAPTWVYVDVNGEAKGFSQAMFIQLEEGEGK